MTQKQALKNILESLNHPTLRRLFICRWLEDINWHGECAEIQAGFTELDEENLALANKIWGYRAVEDPAVAIRLAFQRYDYLNANERLLPGFVHAFGWGIDPTDWDSDGAGPKFVWELEKMLSALDDRQLNRHKSAHAAAA